VREGLLISDNIVPWVSPSDTELHGMELARLDTLKCRTAALIDQLHGILLELNDERARESLSGSIGSSFAVLATRFSALVTELESLGLTSYLMHPVSLPTQDPDFGNTLVL
jgi:hypothetical protein